MHIGQIPPLPLMDQSERRQHQRYSGRGLVAQIGPLLCEVLDISFGGLRIDQALPAEGKVSLKLMWQTGSRLEVNHWLSVEAVILRVEDGTTSLRFRHVTYALAKMIVQTVGLRLGVSPYLVK